MSVRRWMPVDGEPPVLLVLEFLRKNRFNLKLLSGLIILESSGKLYFFRCFTVCFALNVFIGGAQDLEEEWGRDWPCLLSRQSAFLPTLLSWNLCGLSLPPHMWYICPSVLVVGTIHPPSASEWLPTVMSGWQKYTSSHVPHHRGVVSSCTYRAHDIIEQKYTVA